MHRLGTAEMMAPKMFLVRGATEFNEGLAAAEEEELTLEAGCELMAVCVADVPRKFYAAIGTEAL